MSHTGCVMSHRVRIKSPIRTAHLEDPTEPQYEYSTRSIEQPAYSTKFYYQLYTNYLVRHNSQVMMSRTNKFNEYRLHTVFQENIVIHTHVEPNDDGEEPAAVLTAWKREKEIGPVRFGTIWIEKEVGSNELRATRTIQKGHLRDVDRYLRELEVLAKVTLVCFIQIRVPRRTRLIRKLETKPLHVISRLV